MNRRILWAILAFLAVASLAEHPLPKLAGFGIPCSISTDDPEMFDTDLGREYEVATSFGISPRTPKQMAAGDTLLTGTP